MDIRRTDASVCIRIAIAGLARLRARGSPEDSPAAGSRLGVADIRTVRRPVVEIPVTAVDHRVWGSRLKSSDSGNRPAARQSLPETPGGSGNLPKIKDGESLSPVEVAQATIQLQSPQRNWNGCQISIHVLSIHLANSFAGAVQALRPGIGAGQLKATKKVVVHTGL